MNRNSIDLTGGTPWKVILQFALPLMLSSFLQQFYSTVDTIIVGNMESQNALSAVGSCVNLVMLYVTVAMGVALAAGVLLAQAYGAKNTERMKQISGAGTFCLLFLGLFVSLLSELTAPWLLRHLISVPEEIYDLSVIYVRIYSLGMIFQCGYNIFASMLRAVGDSKSSLYFLLVTSVVNIVLDYTFVGIFHWGVAGVGWATVISQFTSMLVSYIYMTKKYDFYRPQKKYWKWDREINAAIFKLGIPMSIGSIVSCIGFMFLQKLVNSFGADLTASYIVAIRLEIYAEVPITAFNSALSTYTGQNIGAKQKDRIHQGIRQAVCTTEIIALCVGSLLFIFAPNVIRLFGLNGVSVSYCTAHIRLVCFDLLLYAFIQPFYGVYQGLGKTKVTMACAMSDLAMRILFGYLLVHPLGAYGCWSGEPFGWGFVCIVMIFLYRKGFLNKCIDAKLV